MSLKANYRQAVKAFQPKPPYVFNSLKAFVVGGALCAVAELFANSYSHFFSVPLLSAQQLAVMTMMFFAIVFTGAGKYDDFSQFAGAGATMTLAGFANALASAALEHRSEGWTAGIASQMFKAGGAAIVYGVVAAYLLGILYYIMS
ncbi:MULTISPECIES: SpoVA/SpoVAEb family sporulation membrane protein [Parageobacillus]|jgi:stage V sporulation protein AC|uniref:Stage V sporulation protein AC n=1 Tax=Parageobacillus thermoglucosidasius TaxID=1426 RepID=A0A1B7KXE9_PARTM|nr:MULTISPECIES: SpoVA/SpoVAEb family sporulation membrane protein [Parageobacillus]OAT74695.1 stage V sporulation protein AC [Parageobacillus thermoglucosidasius]BDG46643.1 stage V sporulation protein AC [Parageobacillus sp. KH3-4]